MELYLLFQKYEAKLTVTYVFGNFKHTVTRQVSEAEFLDVIGTKVLRVFLLAINSHLYQRILSQSSMKLASNVNIYIV